MVCSWNRHLLQSAYILCCIGDEDLPEVPSLTVTLPPTYPSVSPISDLDHYQRSSSPFIREVGRHLSERLTKKISVYTFSTLLDYWEMSVLKALAKELLTEED